MRMEGRERLKSVTLLSDFYVFWATKKAVVEPGVAVERRWLDGNPLGYAPIVVDFFCPADFDVIF